MSPFARIRRLAVVPNGLQEAGEVIGLSEVLAGWLSVRAATLYLPYLWQGYFAARCGFSWNEKHENSFGKMV